MGVLCKERKLPCGLCCPSYHNGCVAYGEVSRDLESSEKSLAEKKTVNILTFLPELLNAGSWAG